jgi:hypothetical protein
MACRSWSQWSGMQVSGLCSTGLLPETSNPSKSCIICIEPVDVLVPDCGCIPPLKKRELYYMSVSRKDPTFLDECVIQSFLGNHILTGKCGAGGGNQAVINYHGEGVHEPPECDEFGTWRPNIDMLWIAGPTSIGGRWIGGVKVTFYYAQMITGGPLPGPVIEVAASYTGGVPWCTNTRGSTVLGYDSGFAGDFLRVEMSTEPF